jgi:hypothetical protein
MRYAILWSMSQRFAGTPQCGKRQVAAEHEVGQCPRRDVAGFGCTIGTTLACRAARGHVESRERGPADDHSWGVAARGSRGRRCCHAGVEAWVGQTDVNGVWPRPMLRSTSTPPIQVCKCLQNQYAPAHP